MIRTYTWTFLFHWFFSLLFLSLFFIRSFSQIQNSLQQVTNMGHLTSIGKLMSKGNNLQHSNVNPPQKAIELFTFYLNTLWIGTSKSLFLFLESRLRRKENNSRQSKIWYWKKTRVSDSNGRPSMKKIWLSFSDRAILMRSESMMHWIAVVTWVIINLLHCWTNHFSILQKSRENFVGR